jgi:hypothetical protein
VTEWGNRNSLLCGGQDFRYTEQADVEAIRPSTFGADFLVNWCVVTSHTQHVQVINLPSGVFRAVVQ